jgi:hypothetical protein
MRPPTQCAGLGPITSVVGLLLLFQCLVALVFAQPAASAILAKKLAGALDAAKIDAIAAADPADPSAFVAALYIPGGQILAISAKYAAPSLLIDKIRNKNYRDVYIDLSSASIPGSKTFVIDTGVDGLAVEDADSGADTWEQGSKQVTFDGEWKKAKLSEADYLKVHATADEQYAKMLSALLDEVSR